MKTSYFLIRHMVADFEKWKKLYAQHVAARIDAGLHELRLFRNMENPNEIFILFEVDDIDKAKEFLVSNDLREKMKEVEILDKADVYFLT